MISTVTTILLLAGLTSPLLGQDYPSDTSFSGDGPSKPIYAAGRVNLAVEQAPLADLLKQLMEAGAPLVYASHIVGGSQMASCPCPDVTLSTALDRMLQGTRINYRKIEETGQIALVPAPEPGPKPAPTGGVQGRVISSDGNTPLEGVNVQLVGTPHGTPTRRDGRYVLLNVPAGSYWLRAELIGFHPDSQRVVIDDGGMATANFVLTIDPVTLSPLEAVVSTGTLTDTRRRALGTSISTISEEQIRNSGATNLVELLQGNVPGVAAMSNSGLNASGHHIQIRGVSSFQADQAPLIYVDGAPVDGGSSGMNRRGQDNVGLDADDGAHIRLDELALDQIERIEIIKGSAASTMYGSEAINGVIQIFTKRGRPGEVRLNATIEQGVSGIELDESYVERAYYGDEVRALFRRPHTQRYTASLTGGQGDLSYTAGINHNQSAGVTDGNDERQTSINASFGKIMGDRLTLRINGSLVQRRYNTRQYRSLLEYADLPNHRGDFSQTYRFRSFDEAVENQPRTQSDVTRFYSSANIGWRPVSFWQNHITLGIDHSQEDNESIGRAPFRMGDGFLRDRIQRNFNRVSGRLRSTINYPADGPVTSAFSFGVEGTRDEVRRLRLRGVGLPSPGTTGFDHAQELIGGDSGLPTEQFSAIATVGGFVQEQIGFNDRLFLTAGLRVDGSSVFGDNFGLQAYPNLSAAYVLEPVDWWSGKFRLAWGRSGKSPDAFAKELTLQFHRDFSLGLPMVSLNDPGNPDVKPEVGSEIEVGLENYFFGNRASVEVNYFHQTTTDAILRGPISIVSGFFRGPQINMGGLRSQGLEFIGQVTPILTPETRLSLSFNLTHMIENGVVTEIGEHEYLSFSNQTVAWRVLEGISVGRSMRDLIYRSVMPGDYYGNLDYVSGGSRVPTTFGGLSADLQFLGGVQLYSQLSYGFGGNVFDHVRAAHDANAGLIPSATAFHPDVAKARYILSTDYIRLNVLRALYRIPPQLAGRMADRVEVWVEGHNLYTWDKMKSGDPTHSPIDGTLSGNVQGAVRYLIPTPQSYRIGLRMTF